MHVFDGKPKAQHAHMLDFSLSLYCSAIFLRRSYYCVSICFIRFFVQMTTFCFTSRLLLVVLKLLLDLCNSIRFNAFSWPPFKRRSYRSATFCLENFANAPIQEWKEWEIECASFGIVILRTPRVYLLNDNNNIFTSCDFIIP